MNDNQLPPNWVAERARCNLSGMFEALCARVKEDVREINRLPSARRQHVVFDTSEVPGTLVVFWRNEKKPHHTSADKVLFETNAASLTFQRPHEGKISIVPQWSHDDTKCDLYIGNEKHELWKISELALCEFFFGTIGDR